MTVLEKERDTRECASKMTRRGADEMNVEKELLL